MIFPRNRTTWFGQAVVTHDGTLAELRAKLPSFKRQPFGPDGSQNAFLQTIVREPFGDDRRIPVAAVSPQYELIQHTEIGVSDAPDRAPGPGRRGATRFMLAELMKKKRITEPQKAAGGGGLPPVDPGPLCPIAGRLTTQNKLT